MQTPTQILPHSGDTKNYGVIFPQNTADEYFNSLLNDIAWKHDEAFIYGKHIVTARMVAWYGDNNFEYKYSGETRIALTWTPELLKIKNEIERLSCETKLLQTLDCIKRV